MLSIDKKNHKTANLFVTNLKIYSCKDLHILLILSILLLLILFFSLIPHKFFYFRIKKKCKTFMALTNDFYWVCSWVFIWKDSVLYCFPWEIRKLNARGKIKHFTSVHKEWLCFYFKSREIALLYYNVLHRRIK